MTAQPTAEWLAQLARTLLMDLEDAGQAVRFLLRDHDGTFGRPFDTVFHRRRRHRDRLAHRD